MFNVIFLWNDSVVETALKMRKTSDENNKVCFG